MNTRAMIFSLALAGFASTSALAQEDGSDIILPVEAQSCDLPVAPIRIPDEATYDDLVAAKGHIGDFQAELASYRACLDESSTSPELTDGNRMALNAAHNHSVEMEERVAAAFNTAVRAYKERQAAEEG